MAKRFVAVLITLCAALAALCLSGCAEEDSKPSYQLVSEGKLTVAMAPNFPPFDSLDGETPTGFDVSVAREVANRLGLQLEIKAVPFDELVQGVWHLRRCDLGIVYQSQPVGASRFFFSVLPG